MTLKRTAMRAYYLVTIFLAATPIAFAASFNCQKAQTDVEKAVCANIHLTHLDEAMSKNYHHIIASDIGWGARKHIKQTQRVWLKSRNACTTNSCIAQSYESRISELCETPVISGVHPNCIIPNEKFDAQIDATQEPATSH